MAKMRVHELAKELGKDSKEVIALLAAKGFSVTSASSGLDEEQVAAVRGNAGKAAPVKNEQPKTEAPKAEAPKAEAKPAVKEEAPKAAPAPKAEAPKNAGNQQQAKQGANQQPQKKKISIVMNTQNSRMQGQRPAGNNGGNNNNFRGNGGNNYGNNNNRASGRPQAPVRPIKPLTPPSETPTVNMVPEKVQPSRKPVAAEPVKAAPEVEVKEQVVAPVVETPAAVDAPAANNAQPKNERNDRADRNDRGDRNQNAPRGNNNGPRQNGFDNRNQNGGFRGQNGQNGQGRPQGQTGQYSGRGGDNGRTQNNNGNKPYRQGEGSAQRDNRGGFAPAAPGRGFGGNGRDNRSGKGQGAGYGDGRNKDKNFAAAAPLPGEKNRDTRRGKGKDQDRRKEMNYEEESQQKRAGRFIKPEKKKEEVVEEVIKVISLPDTITIKDLAEKMKQRPGDIIKKLFLAGQMCTLNDELSYEEAENIAMEYEILCEHEVKVDVIEELLKEDEDPEETLIERPPVVCVMGHVDHGKTSLLDAIRKTKVTDREAGGITQAIGAYTVDVQDKKITFLDTPGHEAFTAMRMRGANSTDIAILVVAADDGVMPQTVEAINHAKAAGVEIIVAVNKIDKPSANIDRVKQELSEYELISEDWGGSTVFAPVSAKTGEGLDNLLDMILLTADVLELKANPERTARGLVIEAELDKGRGPVATILVQKGTLHVGDFISAGAAYGKVRAMIDDKGHRVKEATPSTPVEILGLSDVPEAGEVFLAHESDKSAKSYAETYKAQNKEKKIAETQGRMSLEDVFSKIKEGNLKELNLIVKADVQGSVEAVKESLTKLSNEEVVVKVIHSGVGAINESDVSLASASNAIIIGFNVRPDATAKNTSEQENVDVRLYDVIYKAIEDVELAMKGMLDPVFEEKIIGHAEVRQIFKASAIGNIAGSYVLDGELRRGCKVRITREGEQIYEGELASLKRFKDDVKEVKTGFECGLVFDGFDKMQEFDQVEAYIMVEVPR